MRLRNITAIASMLISMYAIYILYNLLEDRKENAIVQLTEEYQRKSEILSNEIIYLLKQKEDYAMRVKELPYGKPLDSLIVNSYYGWRLHPVDSIETLHTGVDFRASIGDTVFSTGSGSCSFAGWKNGYGNTIVIDHNLNHNSIYAHLDTIFILDSMYILANTPIGLSGNSGKTSGPHLHYEIRVGNSPINPMAYIKSNI